MNKYPDVILIGAGGHAKVVLDLAQLNGRNVVGVVDPLLGSTNNRYWMDIPVIETEEVVIRDFSRCRLLNGIGFMPHSSARYRVYKKFHDLGFVFETLVHPRATVSGFAKLGEGVQVMAGTVIQAGAVVGNNSIVNTSAIIEHDVVIGESVNISPGAVICGASVLMDQVFVGANATIVQEVSLGNKSIVKAAELVTKSNLLD